MPSLSKSHNLKKTIFLVILAIVLVTGAYSLWRYETVWKYELSNDDAYVHADYVNISPEVSGYIVASNVGDNQLVKAGDILAKIDAVPYQAAVRAAQATVEQAQANINEINAELASHPALIAEAQANVTLTEAAQTYAQQNMDRFGTLAQQGFATQQNRELARTDLSQANDKLQLNKAAMIVAQKKTAILEAQFAGAQAALKQAEAALDTARFNLDRTELRAPIDGVVGNRALRKGIYVRTGSQLLAIVPLHEIYIVANYMETDLENVKAGQPVNISVDAFPNAILHGTVSSIAPAAGQTFALLPPDNATGNFTKIVQRVPIKITINPDDPLIGSLRPGMSVTTTIITNSKVKPAAGA